MKARALCEHIAGRVCCHEDCDLPAEMWVLDREAVAHRRCLGHSTHDMIGAAAP